MLTSLALLLAVLVPASASASPIEDRVAARALFDGGNWAGAVGGYRNIIGRDADHGEDHLYLGWALSKLGRCNEALPELKSAVALGANGERSGLRRAHVETARCDAALGRNDEAISELAIAKERFGFDGFEDLAKEGSFAKLAGTPAFKRLAGQPDKSLSRNAAWRADLAYFDDLVRRRHPSPFHHVSERKWAASVKALNEHIPQLSDVAIIGEFMRLGVSIGDGHTVIIPPLEGPRAFHLIPIWPYRLGADWYVLAAAPQSRDLVGARVTRIAGRPMAEVGREMRAIIPSDNDRTIGFVGVVGLQFLELDELAAGAKPASSISLTVDDPAKGSRTVELAGSPIDRDPTAPWPPAEWPSAAPRTALWLAHPGDAFHVEPLDGGVTIYAQVNRIEDSPPGSFAKFASDLGDRLRAPGVRRLIVDLRHNNGGSGSLNWTLVSEIVRASAVNRRGGLFVITGPRTFSAAMNLASMLETHTPAIFVGEPTGSRPNFYGEDTNFTLPNSRLTGSISSAWFQGGTTSDDQRPFIAPDLPAPLTITDLRSGRDPALEAIRQYWTQLDPSLPRPTP
jgi:hypothetical protein